MSVKEYLAKAAEFEAQAIASGGAPTLQKRYMDLAQSYRLMAEEGERLIANGTIASDAPPPP
jgi:hypothetical protein